MTARNRLGLLAAALCVALSGPSWAAPSSECGPPPDGALCPNGPWFDFAVLSVRLVQGTVTANYEVTQAAGNDLLVKLDETNPRFRGSAEAILIAGTIVGTRSDGSLPARGEELLGDPLLASQEVAGLLQMALPRGPRSIGARRTLELTGSRVFVANTPQATSIFGPPWKLTGTVSPEGRQGYAFELTLDFRVVAPDGTVGERRHTHRYRGRVSYPATRPRLPDSMSLAGWKLAAPQGGNVEAPTLGDVRRALGVASPR